MGATLAAAASLGERGPTRPNAPHGESGAGFCATRSFIGDVETVRFRRRRPTARSRRVLAGGAGVFCAVVLAGLTAGAQATPETSTAPARSGSAATASPSPCTTVPPLPNGPSLPPTPVPTLCVSLLPSPVPSAISSQVPSPSAPSLGGKPGNALSAIAPGATGAASQPGASLPSLQASGLFQLLGLLGTPAGVGVETPILKHFGDLPAGAELTTVAIAATPAAARSGPPAHLPAVPWQLSLAALTLAGALLVILLRRVGPGLAGRAVHAAAGPILALLVLCAAVAVPSGGAAVAHPARLAGSAETVSAARSVVTSSSALAPGQTLLARVASFESRVAHDEAELQVLTAPTASGETSPTAPQRGPFDGSVDPAGTAHLVALSLESTLQDEYRFFASTAADPGQAIALVEAARTQPAPVRAAVVYDVQAVQAQLAEEAAIAQAGHDTPAHPSGNAPARLDAPVQGVITQGFGPSALAFEPALTFDGVTYPHFHTGVDIAGPFDTPVRAAAAGVVAMAGSETDSAGRLVGYGNYIVIAHGGGMITLYGHLDQLLVHAGQVVSPAEVIGLEGSSGNSTGPHVHFEVRIGRLLADPMTYLTAKPAGV